MCRDLLHLTQSVTVAGDATSVRLLKTGWFFTDRTPPLMLLLPYIAVDYVRNHTLNHSRNSTQLLDHRLENSQNCIALPGDHH